MENHYLYFVSRRAKVSQRRVVIKKWFSEKPIFIFSYTIMATFFKHHLTTYLMPQVSNSRKIIRLGLGLGLAILIWGKLVGILSFFYLSRFTALPRPNIISITTGSSGSRQSKYCAKIWRLIYNYWLKIKQH